MARTFLSLLSFPLARSGLVFLSDFLTRSVPCCNHPNDSLGTFVAVLAYDSFALIVAFTLVDSFALYGALCFLTRSHLMVHSN
jgi:hypothetical protein